MAAFVFNPFPRNLPYRGFANLPIGNYRIEQFKFVRNKFQKHEDPESPPRILMVELAEEIVFLPAYFAKNFNDDDELVRNINNDGVTRFLCFGGSRADG